MLQTHSDPGPSPPSAIPARRKRPQATLPQTPRARRLHPPASLPPSQASPLSTITDIEGGRRMPRINVREKSLKPCAYRPAGSPTAMESSPTGTPEAEPKPEAP